MARLKMNNHASESISKIRELNSKHLHALQFVQLPHTQLLMLFDRSTELNALLELCISNPAKQNDTTYAEHTLRTVEKLCTLLRNISESMVENLRIAQRMITYEQYHKNLVHIKNKSRLLASKTIMTMQDKNQEYIPSSIVDSWSAISSEILEIKTASDRLCEWAKPKIDAGLQSIDKVCILLEQHDALSLIASKMKLLLKQNALQHIADSKIFDKTFYAEQLQLLETKSNSAINHYLTSEESIPPHPFFNPQFYRNAHPEVTKLRYYALEHFVRYGEAMNHSPSKEFDTTYYLNANEDVLDSGTPPLRHFLTHGIPEGRPPCANAGAFFINSCLPRQAVRLGFVGTVDESCRKGWDMLREHCNSHDASHAVNIPSAEWTGAEKKLDAYVIGSEAIAQLHGDLLQTIAESKRKLLYIGNNPQEDLEKLLRQDILPPERICALTPCYSEFIRWQESKRRLALHFYSFTTPERDIAFIRALLDRLAQRDDFRLRRIGQWGAVQDDGPAISIISIIYKKSREMKAFLEALNRQDLARPYEVVLVDDASPDKSVEEIEAWLEEKRSTGVLNKFMTVRILRNAVNSGNCTSRNRGVEAARADVVLIADGDVVQSSSNLSEHLWQYRLGDCDAVVGFYRFNMDYDEVFQWLAACEVNPQIVRTHLMHNRESHNRLLPNSIYRYVTRNTSFRKSAFSDYYFDESFNYTSDVNSGYGEEDHEIAARLYFEKKNIRFIESSICVHIRHGDNSNNADKALANLRNWNRLIDKHPELTLIDRQYYQWRTRDLLAKTQAKPDAPEVVNARTRYQAPTRANIILPQSKQLKILTFPFDTAYQHDLFKMHHAFTITDATDRSPDCMWDFNVRPLPHSVLFANKSSMEQTKFDLAILPFDENLLLSGESGDTFAAWGAELAEKLRLTKNMPRLLLCMESQPSANLSATTPGIQVRVEKRRSILRALLQDEHVVCTSYKQQKAWNFAKSSVIWHGFSPQEYPEGIHRNACLTFTRSILEKGLGEDLLQLEAICKNTYPLDYLNIPDPHAGHRETEQAWATAKYQLYAHHLGTYATHCTPLQQMGMPRVRTEAMLTGVIPVTLRSDDTDMFIKNGVNGFSGDSIDELTEYLLWLSKNEEQRKKISNNARLFAMDIFNVDRLHQSWLNLIHRTI